MIWAYNLGLSQVTFVHKKLFKLVKISNKCSPYGISYPFCMSLLHQIDGIELNSLESHENNEMGAMFS